MPELYLVGVCPFDIVKRQRMTAILDAVHPAVVGVELSSDGFNAVIKHAHAPSRTEVYAGLLDQWRERYPLSNPQTLDMYVRSLLASNKAVADYAREKAVPVLYGVSSLNESVGDDFLFTLHDGDGLADFLQLAPKDAAIKIRQQYAQREYAASDAKAAQSQDFNTALTLRRQKGSVAYFGSLVHIFPSYTSNLIDRLRDRAPVRLKLEDAGTPARLKQKIRPVGGA